MEQRTHETFGHAQPDTLGTPTTDTKPSVSDRAREQVQAGRETMQNAGQRVSETAQHAGQRVSETAQTATEQGATFVRQNPGLALAGALGVGVLIGLAIRDRY